ncbi:MAG: DUF4190 domain-containing protein [Planctomycetaceae bacterium]|jgi:hypothetical protein|nr:DUF4190 domain-containing protein [Planctomycetaceae bacterium]
MSQCAFCHDLLEEKKGNIIPGYAFVYAFQQGYALENSPSWQTMKETAVKAITDYEADCSDSVLAENWRRQLTFPNRRFRVCDACFSALRPYLPDNPNDIPRNLSYFSFSSDSFNSSLSWIVPIQTSILAMIAGYAGMFSVLCIPAPLALILGILAFAHLRKHPEKKGMGRAIFAIVMGTVFSLFLCILIGIALLG